MTVLSLFAVLLVLPHTSYTSLTSPLPATCATTVSNCSKNSVCRYTCPSDCPPYASHASDSRILELNYRICSHPTIRAKGGSISIRRDQTTAEVASLFRKKRQLNRVVENLFESANSSFLEELHLNKTSLKRLEHVVEEIVSIIATPGGPPSVVTIKNDSGSSGYVQLIPQWQTEPVDTSVNMNSPFSLYCSVASIGTNAVYSWHYSTSFPDHLVETLTDPADGDLNTKTGTLSFTKAATTHAGYYQCKMTDVVQDGTHIVNSNIVKVTISNNYLAEWASTQKESKSYFQAQKIVIMTCPSIASNPSAVITWYKDGSPFSDKHGFISPIAENIDISGETYAIKKDNLVLMDVTASLNGVYSCRATNPASKVYYDLKQYTLKITVADSTNDNVGPVILKETSVEVDTGSPVTLHCPAVGVPSTITYTWTKNDAAITFDSRVKNQDFGRQIAITSVVSGDSGNYKCKAEIGSSDATTFFQLTTKTPTTPATVSIKKGPSVLYIHNKYNANPASIFIPCEVEGETQTSFLRNGVALVKSDDYTFESGKGLTFSRYNSSDSGIFQCVAFNSAHWKQKMTFVMITENVTAVATADVTLKDTNATLSCAVTGYPYPDVTWTRDGSPITNMDSSKSPYIINKPPLHQLVIKDIKFSDGGGYQCTAKSTTKDGNEAYAHTASSNVTLTIESKVEMKPYQNEVTATVNDTFELSCGAHGKPAPNEVLWYVNGTRINSSAKYKITHINFNDLVTTTSSLLISPLVIGDAGTYNCSASNTAAGVSTNATAEIIMLVKYLKVQVADTRLEIANGDPVTIVCSAFGSPTPDQVRWYIGSTAGTVIQTGGSYTITNSKNNDVYNSTLVISNINSDVNFVCEGLNYLANQAQTDTVKVSVKIYSEVQAYRETSSVSTNLGKETQITCGCKGVPLPKDVTWTKGGLTVQETDIIKKTNTFKYDPSYDLVSVMTFVSPVSSDINSYTCTCVNEYLEKEYTSKVITELLIDIPVSVKLEGSNYAAEGSKYTITCTGTGYPVPTSVTWNVDKSDTTRYTISGKKDVSYAVLSWIETLVVNSFIDTDAKTYVCTSTNVANGVSNTAQAKLMVSKLTPAEIYWSTSNPLTAEFGKELRLTCTAKGLPRPDKIVWTKATGQGNDLSNARFTKAETVVDIMSIQSVLVFSSTTYTDDGTYNCYADNSISGIVHSRNANSTLVTYQKPTVTMGDRGYPGNSEYPISQDGAAELTCKVAAKPAPSKMSWTREGNALTMKNPTVTKDYLMTGTYKIDKVSSVNEGKYICKGNNTSDGVPYSNTNYTWVRIYRSSTLQLTSSVNENTINENTELNLTCTATGVPQVSDIMWTLDSELLTSDQITSEVGSIINIVDYDDINIKSTSVLAMKQVSYKNLGQYKCVTNQTWLGETKTLTDTRSIVVKFDVIIASGKGSSEIIQDVGTTVHLQCDALGNPTPEDIEWRWSNGESIGKGNTSTNVNSYKKSSFLQFSLLPTYHGKEMECISKNTMSPTDKKFKFTLRINNNTMSILQSGSTKLGETLTLTCLTTFTSGAINWYKDATLIVASSRYTFTTSDSYDTANSVFSIKELIAADDGNYTCSLVEGSTTASKNYILAIGSGVVDAGGINTGIVIALIVLAVFIIIVIILLVVIFLHGRKSRGKSTFGDQKAPPTAYHNDAYLDHNLASVITMPDTGLVHDDMPKVVEPIVLSSNVDEHDMKVATIARQATLTQARPRFQNDYGAHPGGRSKTLGRDRNSSQKPQLTKSSTMGRGDRRDWY